ncbi:hypothetical protein R1flu_024973 [Riccia fluitans]|uniref:Uncharacterized GPI-anchored protein At5g19230-like domain-containing protein n=1 Tax=Riccia fluitans TaxID=41844 RepID=A0ABD1XWG2_9MARC
MEKMSEKRVVLLSTTLLLLIPLVVCDLSDYTGMTADDQQVFDLINQYRTETANVSALAFNKAAGCVAHEVAFKFKDNPCTNSTGANTLYGKEQIPDYVNILKTCDVSLDNVKGSQIQPNCLPSGLAPGSGPTVAARNITMDSGYQEYLNDSSYKSGGVGSVGSWYVLALATDQPDGNFGSTPGSLGTTNGQDPLHVSFFTFCGLLVLWIFAAF